MKKNSRYYTGLIVAAYFLYILVPCTANAQENSAIEHIVNATINPLMAENAIPGMAVAIIDKGKIRVLNYGVASKEHSRNVTDDTLFEIGSISKVFTATLACYAQEKQTLSLSDMVSNYFPDIVGSHFDNVSLLELATYTAGGLPLQFPDSVSNLETMTAYYKNWRPVYTKGTHRLYSNPSIGLLGFVAAKSMGESFDSLMEKILFPQLGLQHTYMRLPQEQLPHYAYGYTKNDKAVRLTPGVLDSEAYGVKTSAYDLIRFVALSMNSAGLDEKLQRAIAATQTGYYVVGDMLQGLGWEMYAYPTPIATLLAGNSAEVVLKAHAITKLTSPRQPQPQMLFNKTGSTNGFGAYIAFVPAARIGVALLANKNYPNAARIKAAHHILSALGAK